MRIVSDWKSLPPADRGASVALGNFDGVHRGHQQVIALAADAARRLGSPLGVVTFDPHPRRIFQPNAPSFRLMSAEQQARALADLGVDILYVLPFDRELADLTDSDFAKLVLHEGLGVRHVAVGFDISFGKGRTGSPQIMRRYGEELGFEVSVAEAVGGGRGEKFSSTAVRDALRLGRPDEAARILGRPFAIRGEVVRGRELGRTLGFPTANIELGDYVRPRFGVYATRTRLPDGRLVPGVSSIGVNPTVGGNAPRLEVWLFDFDGDLYGQVVETELVAFLRDEAHFDGVETLTAQVLADAAQARALLLPEL